jgi:hypothetical protein
MVDPVKKSDPDAQELRDSEKAQRTALGRDLHTVETWTGRLQDPELGPVGEAFRRATAGIVRHEGLDTGLTPSAVYHSFLQQRCALRHGGAGQSGAADGRAHP